MLQKADKFHTSLDAPVAGDDDSEMTLLDKMTSKAEDPDHQLEAESLHKDLSSIVGQFPLAWHPRCGPRWRDDGAVQGLGAGGY